MGAREILLLISKLLADLKIPYLLTGSFASSYYGIPRATHDIDFVIEIGISGYPKLEKALKKLQKIFLIDWKEIKDSIKRGVHFEILHVETMIKVDFWPLTKNKFNESRMKRRKELIIFKEKVWTISPEDLILTKLLWCKEVRSDRHMRDCVGIWKVQWDRLDKSYLKSWAAKLKIGSLLKEITHVEY